MESTLCQLPRPDEGQDQGSAVGGQTGQTTRPVRSDTETPRVHTEPVRGTVAKSHPVFFSLPPESTGHLLVIENLRLLCPETGLGLIKSRT